MRQYYRTPLYNPIQAKVLPMHRTSPTSLSTTQVLACGAIIVTLSMGIRHGFGLWLLPITQAQGWTRENFAFAIAIQNLAWGFSGIFAGMLADRFGAARVIMGGSVLYALGLAGMAYTTTPLAFALSTGVLIGMAQAGTTYAVIYGVIGRNVSADKRSWAMGVAAAAGSFGQFLMVPTEGFLISSLGWQEALLALAGASLLMIPMALGLRESGLAATHGARQQSIWQALQEAFKYPSFQLLMAGYFVCGFQVVFIGVHMPSYLKDKGLSPQVASYALALIGLFNVFGTYAAGALGQRLAKRYILAFIYLGRAVAISLFLLAPLTPMSVYLFSAVMGLLWLSTIPPTNAPSCRRFSAWPTCPCWAALCFSATRSAPFMGVWLGGYLYDRTGSYDVVWYMAIALGVMAALVNLPVRESAIARPAAAQA